MYKGHFITSLIAAAGHGKRMGATVGKQYLKLGGKPILAHTLEVFARSDFIDEIILILGKEDFDICKREVIDKYFPDVKIKLTAGGTERQYSIYNGLKSINDFEGDHIVLIHDGVRPFVTREIIKRCIEGAAEFGAAGVGVPVKDTIKIVDEELNIVETPSRSKLWNIQTPQGFKKEIIIKAYEKADREGFLGTDDSTLVERLGIKVKMVMGSYDNIKITTPEDLLIGEGILKGHKM